MKTYTLTKNQVSLNNNYDVIIAGGGPAGCAAAIGAAREGKKALLIEASYSLGGMGTLGLVPWFCGYHDQEKIIARGIAETVLHACRDNTPHLKKAMEENPLATPAIDPELLKRIYDDLVTTSGATILFGSQLCGVEMADNNTVDALLVSNKSGITAYKADVYIDCTGDGDMAFWAGASVEKGDSTGTMQPATHCFVISNIDETLLAKGPGIHFYDQQSPVHKMIDSLEYPLIEDLHSCLTKIGPNTYGFNTGHIYDVDNTDPANLTKAMLIGRQMVAQYKKGFTNLHPAFKNSFLAATGSLLGVRETRRIIGDYLLTVDDYLARRNFPDEICRNAFGIDIHSKSKELNKKSTKELQEYNTKVTKPLGPGESFGVPYRSLTPKGITNMLVAGRCISTDRQANGSTRIMACCLNTGEAAGIAAALAVDNCNNNVHNINTDNLRQLLIDNGAYLP